MAEKSASKTAVTCGASLTALTMFSAILRRMRSCAMSPAAKVKGARIEPPSAMKRSTSSRVMRPSRPVPERCAGSSWFCSKARLTDGDRRISRAAPACFNCGAAVASGASRSFDTSRRIAGISADPSTEIRPSSAPGIASASLSSRISASMPAAGDGTSCVTLSVSSSTNGSLTETGSPIFFNQARTTALVPSCSSGTRTSIIA